MANSALMIAVPRPTTTSSQFHAATSAKIVEKRSKRYTPAFTTAAACRKAETGVAAAIASGSQKWKGNCAALVKPETATRMATVVVRLGFSCQMSAASTSVRRVEPVLIDATANAANSVNPPKNVRISVR